jgi:nucleoside phosphorylase
MIAVTFALRAESSDFLRQHRDAAVLHTGVGQRAVDRTLEAFIEASAPELLISSGFAGALGSELNVGDVLVAENFSDGALLECARSATAVRVATLETVQRVADSPAERARIAQSSGAAAVDMETKFIAAVCSRRGIPMLSLRAITDAPASPFRIPSDVLFDLERQRTPATRLIAHLVRHPTAVGQLMNIARQVKIARHSLTLAVTAVLDALGGK